jgi:hypothetical protein
LFRKILRVILLISPLTLSVDYHAQLSSGVVEIYECMLYPGASVQDVVESAETDFKGWVAEKDIKVTTFIW